MGILVYVIEGCPYCNLLLADLRRRRVAHFVVDLTRSPDRVEEVVRLTWERRVPVVVDHERFTVGFAGGSSIVGEADGPPS